MKEKKDSLLGMERTNYTSMNSSSGTTTGIRSPQIEVREMGSTLEVVLITGLDSQFIFNETIRVLHEEGAEIINASFSVVEDTVFHTIHSQVGDSAHCNEAARISQRLKKFVQDIDNAF
ncbi:unnamed protein product [Dovyalis caffra]|uniref:Uncharacterized protein n=1 Tax=Dovyalis caffra TaxID=77055 RepID=A0AAV1SJJ6_9ROSI|nr:unnamed protein product [Dovyalis caffra]